MRALIALLAAVAAGSVAGGARAANVEIKDAVARVTVVPENRADIRVEVLVRNPRLPLKVREGRRMIIAGNVKPSRIRNCGGGGENATVTVAGLGDLPMAQIPYVVIHTPRNVEVTAGGAVFGAIGRAANVTLGNAGCGDWTIANIDQELKLSLAGSGDGHAGSAALAKLRIAGSGDITTGAVRGRVDIDVAGAGNVDVGAVQGPLNVHVAGSGDVTVRSGRATAMVASVAGSGNVVFKGEADTLDARITGSGDVRARRVRGAVKKAVMGSGTVVVG